MMSWSTTWIAAMSERPNGSEKARSAEDAKAQKRAEIERKVAEARAEQQKEKELKAKAELENKKLEQEKEARKQTQVRELLQEAMREKDEQLARNIAKREEENRALQLELQRNPLQKIMEFKDAASALYKEQEFEQAIKSYKISESLCLEVYRHISISLDEEEMVRKQLSLCKLSRSLCHFNLYQYEDALDCCKFVAQDKVSDQQYKCKAIIRMGQCFDKMAASKGVENKNYLLTSGMECASKAEKMLTDDDTLPRDLLKSIEMLQKSISAKLPAKVDYARGLNSLPSVPAAQRDESVERTEPSSQAKRHNQVSFADSPGDYHTGGSSFDSSKRRAAISSHSTVGSHSDDLYDKSPYAYSRQRFARFPGIRNEGATCWGNCILQVVYHLRSLRVRLYQIAVQLFQREENPADSLVVLVLLQVFQSMDRATRPQGEEAFDSVSALGLWRACETNVLRQNDMHEFFVALIEYFETLFKRSSALSPENGAATFFHRLFSIVSQNRISVEEFGYDQPAGDGSNVSECVLMVMDPWNQRTLRNFLRFKFVDGETVDTYINSKLHEGCADKKCPGHRARLFSSLVQCPDVLCCFLNRIEHNYDDGSQSKNSDPFEYPEQFSMADYVHESLGPDSVYDLYAVVVHTGAVLAGHYFSFMRPEVSSSTGTLQGTPWYRFDDERVFEVEASQALVENFGTGSAGHRRNMWNWQTIKYGRTACMLFYVRRSAARHILASGAAAAAVQTSITSMNRGGAAVASAVVTTASEGGAAAANHAASQVANLNNPSHSTPVLKTSSAAQSPPKEIWSSDEIPSPANIFDEHHAQYLIGSHNYTDLRKALQQLNRLDALSRFQSHELDDYSVDLATHEQFLEELGLSFQENAELMNIWRGLRGLRDATPSASRNSPIDIKFRSLAVSSSAIASLPARSVISPDASLLPVFNKPSLSVQSIVDTVSTLCLKKVNEKHAVDSDDDNDADITTSNSVEHLPAYLRAYHPRLLIQLRAFLFHLQHVSGPVEPVVTLEGIPADASLVLAWTVSSLTHVSVSVCAGTWGVGDPTPTYVGSPVVVCVQLCDSMSVVKNRAVECFLQRNVGSRGEELARRRINMLGNQLCLLTDSGDTTRIQDEELVSAYYEEDAVRHGEDDASHGYVMNLMLLTG